jgi:hypothetical protein
MPRYRPKARRRQEPEPRPGDDAPAEPPPPLVPARFVVVRSFSLEGVGIVREGERFPLHDETIQEIYNRFGTHFVQIQGST